MGKALYFDCFSGVSGDMVLGALLDLGLPLEGLKAALGSLAIEHGTVVGQRVLRAGISATKFRLLEPGAPGLEGPDTHVYSHAHPPDPSHAAAVMAAGGPGLRVHQPELASAHSHGHGHSHSHEHPVGQGHHSLAEIGRFIDRSALSVEGRARAKEMFGRLAEAEAAIHDMPLDRIHLHEVGALDSIIDIVGTVFGMEWLGVTDVVSSPINVGSGTVTCAHGVFPVPAPATARLLQDVPIYAGPVAKEMTTPTGALVVTTYARSFGPLPPMSVSRIGYGAGDRDFPDHPNVLRLMLGVRAADSRGERIVEIACEIDDMNPQLFGPLMDRLYETGALDVYYASVQMKKNRPGTLVTVIAPPERREALSHVLFTETTTIGVRYQEMDRERLDREMRAIDTPVGSIRFKVARRAGAIVNASPEFEDCARVAAERGVPIKEVQAIAVKAWLDRVD